MHIKIIRSMLWPLMIATGLSSSLAFSRHGAAPKPSGEAKSPGHTERKTSLAITLLGKKSKEELDRFLSPFGLNAKNSVSIFKLSYPTRDLNGKWLMASGIVLVPADQAPGYPWISLQHGTIVDHSDTPSQSPSEGIFEASQGFVTVVMDYLGFGDSADMRHPYLVEKAYAEAGIDMLRATKSFAKSQSISLGPLFLKGYSEGGYATVALQKALESMKTPEFSLLGSAPGAGPYNLDNTGRILLGRPYNNPVNLPNLLLSYQTWLSKRPVDIRDFLKPDLGLLNRLFDGTHTSQEILEKLPSKTDELFHNSLIKDFLAESPKSRVSNALHAMLLSQSLDRKGWAPKTRTQLYHCADDETVPVEVTLSTFQQWKRSEPTSPVSTVVIHSPEGQKPYTHRSCPAVFSAVEWFATILSETAKSKSFHPAPASRG